MIEFVKIKDFPNYIINTKGDVVSLNRKRPLSQYESKGYMGVYLYSRGKRKYKFIHRLVAESFIPNPKNLPQVNHKDENTKNNAVYNLEWCSAKYNCNYGLHNQHISEKSRGENNGFYGKQHTETSREKMRKAKLGKPSLRKRAVVINGVEYDSITSAMKELNLSTRKIYKILEESKND